MYKLTILRNAPMIHDLMQRLEDASIKSTSAPDVGFGEIEFGAGPSTVVWIDDEKDRDRASEILREMQARYSVRKCPHCECDLRDHAGEATCPECGHDLDTPTADIECECGEKVPAHFEVCWSCGRELRSPTEPTT